MELTNTRLSSDENFKNASEKHSLSAGTFAQKDYVEKWCTFMTKVLNMLKLRQQTTRNGNQKVISVSLKNQLFHG